jgi:phosphoribosyl 1,2-cyclic phosphodiesterase
MRIDILGCRGSTPATGATFSRYGGDTSCVAVTPGGEAAPSLLLDAGTGLVDLNAAQPFRGAILLTHLHWDHTHGLPFSPAVDHHDAEIDLYLPAQGDPVEVLSRAIGPPHFPITPLQLRGRWRFHGLDDGEHEIAGFRVTAREITHKGGRTFGYRLDDGTTTLAYLPDHAPGRPGSGPIGLGEIGPHVVALVGGVDVLIHDAQHLAREWPEKAFLGHATVEYAVDVAQRMDVARLMLFHHDPGRTDDELDAITHEYADAGVVVADAARVPVPKAASADATTWRLGDP